MLCKYVLTVDGIAHEIPKSCIKNWDGIRFSRKRTGLEGITRAFTSKFEFIGNACDILLNEYLNKYLASNVLLTVYSITNNHTYRELFGCKLDFSSFSYDGHTISINSIDDSVANIIKANKGTGYEYDVSELKEKIGVYYDRIDMNSVVNYVFGGGNTNDDGSISYDFYSSTGTGQIQHTPIDTFNNDINHNPGLDFVTDESYTGPNGTHVKRYGAVKNISDKKITISLNIDLEFSVSSNCSHVKHMIFEIDEGIETSERVTPGNSTHYVYNQDIVLKPSQRIMFVFHVSPINFNQPATGIFTVKVNTLRVKFASRAEPIYIDAIKPVSLLNSLIKSMNDGKDNITGEIESNSDDRLRYSMLIAAESIRNIAGAKIYTSYTKFVDWMEAEFGYIPQMDGNIVRFIHRDSLYNGSNAKDLGDNFSDFQYRIDASRIYSSIKVGYDKQDYGDTNGRDEFRFTVEYTTGIDITDNVLELISPYRADVYGIEFLAQKRDKGTTDNESDNDVFFIGVNIIENLPTGTTNYVLIRNVALDISGVLSPSTMFNVMFWQRAMVEANLSLIAMSSNLLKYSSSDGNSDVVVNEVSLKDDFVINGQLLTCGDIEFNVYDEDVSVLDNEVVRIENNGIVYEGYIKEVTNTVEKTDGVKYKLLVSSVSRLW